MPAPSTSAGGGRRAPGRKSAGAIAIAGGGISGLAAAYELARHGASFALFEASPRFGGIVETVRKDGFLMEGGPDSWVSDKPWALDLAAEMGLSDQIVPSNDRLRATYLLREGTLVPLPEGLRLIVPTDWEAFERSPLLSAEARQAYRQEAARAAELRASAPKDDESVASFVRRHFGEEAARSIAAPLLAGIFGGDIESLSVRAVMPAFVKMEQEHGSLIAALQKERWEQKDRSGPPQQAIFSTLTGGMGMLVERIAALLPPKAIRLRQPVTGIHRDAAGWRLETAEGEEHFQSLVLATPPAVTGKLLAALGGEGERMAALLPRRSSSAIVVTLGFAAAQAAGLAIPAGFGFLASGDDASGLLACTFADQKFAGRAPRGAALLRAFFSDDATGTLAGDSDAALIRLALAQLAPILGAFPEPAAALVRRLPRSLPQYEVGHLERMEELESLARSFSGLRLIGSAYRGVGLSDLIREGRAAANSLLKS